MQKVTLLSLFTIFSLFLVGCGLAPKTPVNVGTTPQTTVAPIVSSQTQDLDNELKATEDDGGANELLQLDKETSQL